MFDVVGSGVVDVAVAVLMSWWPGLAAGEHVGGDRDGRRVAGRDRPDRHVTVAAPTVQPGAVTLSSPAGRSSVTVTPAAAEGPSLITVIVQVTDSPATTVAGVAVLVTFRSAAVLPVVVNSAVSSVGSGSMVVDVTRAWFVAAPPAGKPPGTFIVITICASAPAAISPSVQSTAPAAGGARTFPGWGRTTRT